MNYPQWGSSFYGNFESQDSYPLDGRVTTGSEGLVRSGDGDKP